MAATTGPFCDSVLVVARSMLTPSAVLFGDVATDVVRLPSGSPSPPRCCLAALPDLLNLLFVSLLAFPAFLTPRHPAGAAVQSH
jgi:hypothetical protein